jgi:GDPmannose 4,6-dehydratase
MSPPSDHRRTALICGITGQDGCYLAAHLLGLGYRVVGTSRDATPARLGGLRQLGIDQQVVIEPASLAEAEPLVNLIERERPDVIYHLAGQSSVAVSFDKPAETFESIATSTLHLLEAIRTAAVPPRLFVAGSSEIFGTRQTTPVTCCSPLDPQNPYAVAKTTAFRIVQQYRREHGLFACTGVLFNHESPLRPARFVTQKIVAGACEIAAGRQQELRLGDLSMERDWGWAAEYVVAMEQMLTRDTPEDFILATGRSHRLQDFVAAAFRSVGLDWQDYVVRDEQFVRPNDGSHPLASVAETTERLGWTATVQLSELVRRMVAARQSDEVASVSRAA